MFFEDLSKFLATILTRNKYEVLRFRKAAAKGIGKDLDTGKRVAFSARALSVRLGCSLRFDDLTPTFGGKYGA